MNSTSYSYFLASSLELTPEEVALGSVLTNVKFPHQPLAGVDPTTPLGSPAHTNGPSSASGLITASADWGVGLFSSFVQMMTIGGEISYDRNSLQEFEYSCDKMETRKFTPSQEYVNTIARNKAVSQCLKFRGIGSHVFVVTGLKIAREITVTTTVGKGYNAEARVGLDVSQLKVGPQASRHSGELATHTRTIDGPIVFAFQVQKLRVSLKGEVKSDQYVKGAMLGKESSEEYIWQLGDDTLDDNEAADFALQRRNVVDEITGENCVLFW